MKRNLIFILIAVVTLSACVPQRKYLDLQNSFEKNVKENAECKTKQQELQTKIDELTESYNKVKKDKEQIEADTLKFGEDYRKVMGLNKELNSLYEQVVKQNKELLTNATSTSQKLTQDLEDKKRELDAKQKLLDEKQAEANKLADDLKARERKVNELESLIASKDSSMNALMKNVNDALTGFDKGDLTVENKGGKIYVSMSDKLLFKSGSTQVDAKGKDALKKVAEVLKKNPDISVEVEGHTDNVPLSGSGAIKDNWDLSVLRATTIAKILMDESLEPTRITASGHGEFMPKESNSTAEGRAKNRRTEIILSPDLSKLYNMINGKGK